MNTFGNRNISVSFDQYQRYCNTADIIDKIRKNNEKFNILEIGAGGHRNLERFLLIDEITYLDIELSDEYKNDSSYILGDATNMETISDNSYDCVIALDVYEHIPEEKRNEFLSEIVRVSNKLFIIAAPFNTPGVSEAEIRVNEYYKAKYGEDYIWLKEHIENGLPNLNQTLNFLTRKEGLKIQHFSHGSLILWEKLIRMHFEVADNLNIQSYRQVVDDFYNKILYHNDVSNENYRNFILGYMPTLGDDLAQTQGSFNKIYETNLLELDSLIQSVNYLNSQSQLDQLKDQLKDQLEEFRKILESKKFVNRVKRLIKLFLPNSVIIKIQNHRSEV